MRIESKTKNQHFISQVEQRLNACNPEAEKSHQRIYEFGIIDRENYKIKLKDGKGKLIEKNMSWYDLFSFDVVDNRIRNNLEVFFCHYENTIKVYTKSLLEKLQANNYDIKQELLDLFASKLMNFFRNPYCIKKALNTIGTVINCYPLDRELSKMYASIDNGRKPHQKRLCSELGITNDMYRNWLKALFIIMMRSKDDATNILELLIKSLYEKDTHIINVFVFQYIGEHYDKRPLLSDRSYSIPFIDDGCLAFYFNLCSSAFIRYTFVDVKKQNFVTDEVIEHYKMLTSNVEVSYVQNDLEALESYNRKTVYQAKEKVYCSSKTVYSL